MGIVHRGIPQARALELRDLHGLKYFVETGSLVGNTAAWASDHFATVQTIEVSEVYHQKARTRTRGMSNVVCYHADSATYLKAVLESLPGSALIWLDAHWSRDLGSGKPNVVCPILDEVKQIVDDGGEHVVLIDDARLFGKDGWPSVDEICMTFGVKWGYKTREDVLEFVPIVMRTRLL